MDKAAELEQLLAGLLDGTPDAARNRRLGELLRAHPELQREYIDTLQLHALLQWRVGTVVRRDRPPVETAVPRARSAARMLPMRLRRVGLIAAAILVLLGGALVLFRTLQPETAPDAVERLVDWNLDLAQAPMPEERSQIYQREVTEFKALVASAQLAPEDRDLADTLLANSAWLARNDDAIAAADRFNDIAERVVARMDTAQDPQRVVQLAYVYTRLMDLGIDGNLDRAVAAGTLNAEQKVKVKHLIHSKADRATKLAGIVERHPDATGKAIGRAMKHHLPKTKHRVGH